MFLSKSDEETTSNRRLAKDLVDKWVNSFSIAPIPLNQIPSICLLLYALILQSRPIFNKSTRFEDMRNLDEDRVPYRRPAVKK